MKILINIKSQIPYYWGMYSLISRKMGSDNLLIDGGKKGVMIAKRYETNIKKIKK